MNPSESVFPYTLSSVRRTIRLQDLLNYFEDEVRFIPHINHPDGYIMFDKKMLISILRSDDTKMRYGLAKTLEKFDEAGGELVIMQQPSIQ